MSLDNEPGLLTFELDTPYHITVKSGGIVVGRIWSRLGDGTSPYPHKEFEENIQVCGIERYVDTGQCGPFPDNTDMVIYFGSGKFVPGEDDYQPTFGLEESGAFLETDEEILAQLTEGDYQPIVTD